MVFASSMNTPSSPDTSYWGISLPSSLESGIELNCSLKVLLSKLVHPEILQSEADHPVVMRIAGRELVGLPFIGNCFCGSAQRRCRSCQLIIGQDQTLIPLHGVVPNGNSFLLKPQLPERFALFLASEN